MFIYIIFILLACIAPILLMYTNSKHYTTDEEGMTTDESISDEFHIGSMIASIMCVMMLFASGFGFYMQANPRIDNVHRLRSLEHEQVYKVLQKYEHKWRTYYFIEHSNGVAGLYWSRTDLVPTLGLGYYKLERKRHNSEKMQFTPICGVERNYCAT